MSGLPYYNDAIIDIAKIRDYCLNPNHPVGRNKARIFLSVLGITKTDSEWLINQIKIGLNISEAIELDSDKFG